MGRREWAWAAGSGLTLLLAAWVSGAGSITAFTTSQLSPRNPKKFGEDVIEVQEKQKPRGPLPDQVEPSEIVTTIVVWTLRLLLVLIIAAILFFVVRTLIRLLRRDRVTTKDAVEAGLLPDVLVAGVRDSEAQLDHGTSSEAVINAWLTLERTVQTLGVEDDRSRTPAELVTVVLSDHDVDRDALERLADLYREARFSVHPIGEEQREAARQSLRQVRADLTRPLAALGEVRR